MMQFKETDLTQSFFDACQGIQPGDLCHVKSFDLQDVMTAIELMDPKMDSRMKIHRKVTYITEALENNILPLEENMDARLLIGIIDETFACLVNWLKGDTLGQTVFINMYMHCTDMIQNKALRGFCEALKHIIIFVKFTISKASVSEEEDFYLSSSKMPLDDCPNENKVSGLLKEVDEELSKSIKSKSCESEDMAMCLQHRIRFVRNLLLWCGVIRKQVQTGNNKTGKETNTEGSRYLGLLRGLIDRMIETVDKGEPAGEGKKCPMTKEYGLTGFEAYLNQPLLPPAIPRCADIEERLPALTYLQEMLARLAYVSEILAQDLTTNVIDAWNYLQHFGTFGCEGSPKSCVFSRSLLMNFYLSQFSFPVNELPANSFANSIKIDCFKSSLQNFLCLTCWPEIEEVIKLDEKLTVFLSVCAENIFQIPITHCLNRSRQRTRLELIIDANWELYDECTKVDHLLRSFINHKNSNSKRPKDIPPLFSSFVAVVQFRTMLDYLISGFELGLYAPQEWTAVYFVLAESVLKYFVSHYRELEMGQTREQALLPRLTGLKKSRRRQLERQIISSLEAIRQNGSKLRAYHELVSGYFLLLSALSHEKRLPLVMGARSQTPGNARLVYEKRFGALVQRGWFADTAGHSQFEAASLGVSQRPVAEVYSQAACHFDSSRRLIADLPPALFTDSSANQLATIAKTNWIVSRLLASGSRTGPVSLHFLESNERAFPLVKL